MRFVVVVLLGAWAASGCRSAVELDQPLQFQCSVTDGGVHVGPGEPDPQCPEHFRCGLEGRCHGPTPAPYLCTDDTYCEGSDRCGPDGTCVSTASDALLPRTAPPPSMETEVPRLRTDGVQAFGASPYSLLRLPGCPAGLGRGRTATWVASGVVYRAAQIEPLDVPDAGGCDLTTVPVVVSAPLPSPLVQVTEVLDTGARAVLLGKDASGQPAHAFADWQPGTSLQIFSNLGFGITPSHVRAAVDHPAGGQNDSNYFVELGQRQLAFNGAGELVASTRAFPASTDVVTYQQVDQQGGQLAGLEELIASGRDFQGQYTVFDSLFSSDAVLALADGGLFLSELNYDAGVPFLRSYFGGDAGLPTVGAWTRLDFPPSCGLTQPVALRYDRPAQRGARQGPSFLIADFKPRPDGGNNGGDSDVDSTQVRRLELVADQNGPSNVSPQDCLVNVAYPTGPQLSDGGYALSISTALVLRAERFTVCEGARVIDFSRDLDPQANAVLVRAACTLPDGGVAHQWTRDPSGRIGGKDERVSTANGQQIVPEVPYFQQQLLFSFTHPGVHAQMDERGHLWSTRTQNSFDYPGTTLAPWTPDRPLSVVMNDLQQTYLVDRPVQFGGELVEPSQGWASSDAGTYSDLAFQLGDSIFPVAPVRGQPTWMMMYSPTDVLPVHMFVMAPYVRVPGADGVVVPARIADLTVKDPPYRAVVTPGETSGSSLMLMAVNDALLSLDVTRQVKDPLSGFINSASEVLKVPAAEVRLTPVPRGPIQSLAPQSPVSADGGTSYARGYLTAAGRLFHYEASSEQVWRADETFMPRGAPLAVVNQVSAADERARMVFRDGRVFGLPSRTELVPASGEGDAFSDVVSACGEVVAIANGQALYLDAAAGAGSWKPIPVTGPDTPRIDQTVPAHLFAIRGGIVLVDSDGEPFRIRPSGGCP